MRTTIIKSNRLRDSPLADTIWMGFNNAVRDSFSRLSSPRPRNRILGPLREVKDVRKAVAIPRFDVRHPAGDASQLLFHNQLARLGAPLFRVRVLLDTGAQYAARFSYSLLPFRFYSFYSVQRLSRRKITAYSLFFFLFPRILIVVPTLSHEQEMSDRKSVLQKL